MVFKGLFRLDPVHVDFEKSRGSLRSQVRPIPLNHPEHRLDERSKGLLTQPWHSEDVT